jgi:hypothetical protein
VEIREWIRAIGSRLALIAVVAGVAALLAAVLALFQPQQYQATATLALPEVPAVGPLTSQVAQRIANFEGAVTSDGVLDAVAERTGAPRPLLDGISVVRSGSGNVMEVRFVGRDADQSRAVVTAATQEGLLLQAETDKAFAEAEAAASEALYNDAQSRFEEQSQATEIFAPDEVLADLSSDYRRADARGDVEDASEIQQQILVAREVQRLRNDADAALDAWTADLAALNRAEGQVRAAEAAQPRVGDVVRLSKLQAMIKQGAYAALFGAALAVGFVIIVELLRSGTGTTRPSLPRPTRQRSSAGAF